MSDGDALLRAILDAPDDDAPRLIYADWLDEHGDSERAEFIRVQCELAAFPQCPRSHFPDEFTVGQCVACQMKCGPLRRRERALWSISLGWAHPLNGDLSWFRRGFVECPELPADKCLAHLDAIRERHPVREVRLTTWPNETRAQYSHRWPGITFHLPQREVPPSLDGLLAGYASGIITANEVRDFLAGRH